MAVAVTLTTTMTATTPAAPQAPERIAVPDTIDPTGETDVSAELGTFIALAPTGAIVEFAEAATYRIDAGLEIRRVGSITIDGNDATLLAPDDGATADPPRRAQRSRWPRNRRMLAIVGTDQVTIRDLTIDGPNPRATFVPELEGQAGVFVARSNFVTLDRIAVREVYGDGVYVTGTSQAVVVVNSEFESIGRQGIAIVQGTDIQITANSFDKVARSVVDVEPTRNAEVRNVDIRDNTIGDYENFALAAAGGGPNVDDIVFTDNSITGGRGLSVFAGVPRQPRSGLTITNNRSQVPSTAAIGPTPLQITNYSEVTIERNTSTVTNGTDVVTLNAVCAVEIADNVWPGARREVVEIADCGALAEPPPTVAIPPRTTQPTDPNASTSTSTAAPAVTKSPPAHRDPDSPDSLDNLDKPGDDGDDAVPAGAALVIGLVLGALGMLVVQRRASRAPGALADSNDADRQAR